MNFKKGDLIHVDECGSEVEVEYHSKIEDGWHVVSDSIGYYTVREERIVILDTPEKKFKSFLKQSGMVHPSVADDYSKRIMDYFKENPVTE